MENVVVDFSRQRMDVETLVQLRKLAGQLHITCPCMLCRSLLAAHENVVTLADSPQKGHAHFSRILNFWGTVVLLVPAFTLWLNSCNLHAPSPLRPSVSFLTLSTASFLSILVSILLLRTKPVCRYRNISKPCKIACRRRDCSLFPSLLYPLYTCKISVLLIEPFLFLFSCLLSSCPDLNFFSAACAEVAGVQEKVKKMMKGDKINTSEDRCVQEAEYRDTVGRSHTHVKDQNGSIPSLSISWRVYKNSQVSYHILLLSIQIATHARSWAKNVCRSSLGNVSDKAKLQLMQSIQESTLVAP